ncbi:MAG: hypothetical protein E4H08_10730, partial [Candidatus Atribacteria bacterium]
MTFRWQMCCVIACSTWERTFCLDLRTRCSAGCGIWGTRRSRRSFGWRANDPGNLLSGARGLHRIRPESGLLLLACALFAVLGAGSMLVKAGTLLLVFVLAVWSEGSILEWCRSLRFVAIFSVLLFLAQVLTIREGTSFFRFGVPITSGGVLAGINMALRFLVVLSASFLFVLTTDPD